MAIDERRRIAHLLRRAGFGATPAELEDYLALGYDGAIDRLLYPEEIEEPNLDEALPIDLADPGALQIKWLYRMVHTKRPLAEKIALFWHGHFATSIDKVKSVTLMWDQYELFRDQGLGRFEDLVLGVSQNPAMLVWLDNWRSKAEAPNENYARELMELFTLGLGNYSEDDVKAGARAFTGWSIAILTDAQIGDEDVPPDKELTTRGDQTSKQEKAMTRRTRDAEYAFRPRWHDDGEKTFLGQTGAWDGDDIVRIIAAQPACATFVATKLFSFFVWDQPDAATVAPYAKLFTESSGDIRSMLAAMFASPEFSSDRAYRAKVKSPVELIVNTLKLLGMDPPLDVNNRKGGAIVALGQIPFAPPNVGGWTSGLGWIGPSTILGRYNLVLELLGGADKRRKNQSSAFDAEAFLAGAPIATATDLVDLMVDRVLEGDIAPDQRTALISYVAGTGSERQEAISPGDPRFEEKLHGLIRLTMSIPTYQLA